MSEVYYLKSQGKNTSYYKIIDGVYYKKPEEGWASSTDWYIVPEDLAKVIERICIRITEEEAFTELL
jgi:hypothetical protein